LTRPESSHSLQRPHGKEALMRRMRWSRFIPAWNLSAGCKFETAAPVREPLSCCTPDAGTRMSVRLRRQGIPALLRTLRNICARHRTAVLVSITEQPRVLLPALALLLALSACAAEKPMHDYKQNPNPKRRYDITMTIADAPGPFASIEGIAQYQAPDCWYTLNKLEGVHANPERVLPITYAKINDTTYVGTVYLDAMLDEDYFGSGVCKWTLASTHVSLKATGMGDETEFVASVQKEALIAQQSTTTYFLKNFYPRDIGITNFRDFGQTDRIKMASSISDSDLFIITTIPKAGTP
jgi:hypothetical protein